MDKREAKRRACRSASTLISASLVSRYDDFDDLRDADEADTERLPEAFGELATELARRGGEAQED